jgi:hypothetical protein
MGKKKAFVKNFILISLGIVVVLNILGLVVELLIQTNVINVNAVKIKGILAPSSILSLLFIASGITFWLRFYKKGKKLVMWWNIFILSVFLIIFSKIVWPTMLVELIPLYFLVTPCVAILIWLAVFKHLKKKLAPSEQFGWSHV